MNYPTGNTPPSRAERREQFTRWVIAIVFMALVVALVVAVGMMPGAMPG